jgi:succinate dehydrogenase / fumarate reductase cytochrome b subunit
MGIGANLFVLHRLTGLALTVYLYLHLITLGSILQGPDRFNQAMEWMSRPTVRLMELVLVWVVLFHTFNGVRLIVLALAPKVDQKWLAYSVVAASVLVTLASVPFFSG